MVEFEGDELGEDLDLAELTPDWPIAEPAPETVCSRCGLEEVLMVFDGQRVCGACGEQLATEALRVVRTGERSA